MDVTPRQRIAAECERRGRSAVVAGCMRVFDGDRGDAGLIMALGGLGASRYLDQPRPDDYWLRVWAMRGLLWAWADAARPVVILGLRDVAWRVREMAAKVVARHAIDDALSTVAKMRDDPVPRVRVAADRAVRSLSSAKA